MERIWPATGQYLYLELAAPLGQFEGGRRALGPRPAGAYRVRPKDPWDTNGPQLDPAEVLADPDAYRWEQWRPSLYDLVGRKVYARTVTYARIGVVIHADDQHLYMHPCADVIESGAFSSFFGGAPKTFAVIPTSEQWPATVQIGACVTIDPYNGTIPTSGGD